MDVKMIDKTKVTEKSKRTDWDSMIKALCSGELVKIHKSIYWYFLEVLPPIKQFDGGFEFAEGMEHIKRFVDTPEGYYCKQINKINPLC